MWYGSVNSLFFKMEKVILLVILLPGLVLPSGKSAKDIKIAFFIEDDNQFEQSILAIASAMVSINSYNIKPQIFTLNKNDTLRVGDIVCNLMDTGISAIFGPESLEINEIIQSISSALRIPQFQTFWNLKLSPYSPDPSSDTGDVFNLHPSPHALARALATLVKVNDWKSYTVIYEDDDGLLRLQEVLKQRKPGEAAVAFRKLGPQANHRSVLKEIKSKGTLHFILDCKTDHIFDILREAKEHNLLSRYHSYILTDLDAHTLDWSGLNISSNITTFRLVNPTKPFINYTVKRWNNILVNTPILNTIKDYGIEKELRRVKLRYAHKHITANEIRIKTALLYDALNLFITTFINEDKKEKLVVTPLNCKSNNTSKHGPRISTAIKAVEEKEFKKGVLHKPFSGPIRGFTNSGQRSNFEFEVLDFRTHNFTPISVWNTDMPDIITSLLSTETWEEEETKAGKNQHFKVVSRIGAPYLMYKPTQGRTLYGNDRFEGYCMDLMEEICSNMNCTFKFKLVEDKQYGRYDPKTKTWNGLIKELIDLQADLAICDLTITYERRTVVDFTTPFMTLGISILFSKAKKEPPSLLSFSHPLSLDVWLYMATAFLVISMIIFLTARLNPYDWENPHPCDPYPRERENIWTIRNCLWLTLGSIMAQGCDIMPKGVSTRMVTSMWWFFSLIMTACYTANLAAFLTMEQMGPTIESAEDLATQNKIKYGCLKDGSTASFFKDTNITLYHRMWVQMESSEPSVFENNNKDGVKRILKNKRQYAFLMESSTIEYELERNCELMQVGRTLDTKGYGIAMPTNARYRKSMNEAILKLQESGVLIRLKDKWWKEMNGGGQCTTKKLTDDDAARELGLDNVGGVFVVLAAGICIALVIAMGEFLWMVRKVAVVEHLSFKEAFHKELKFAMNIWARKKAVLSSSPKEVSAESKS